MKQKTQVLRWQPCGILRRVVSLQITDVLEVRTASIIRQYAPLKRRSTLKILHSTISQKADIFILAAVRTWNPTHCAEFVNLKIYVLWNRRFGIETLLVLLLFCVMQRVLCRLHSGRDGTAHCVLISLPLALLHVALSTSVQPVNVKDALRATNRSPGQNTTRRTGSAHRRLQCGSLRTWMYYIYCHVHF
jgi:hypothetical protein